ncbi:hypothetical protein ACEWY4_024799 [Coilia grayii]|uniref:Bulb-type lectin domain-containing protein n=1 Tax=Coilia grayii TaxID=363190 RepID=A0ABD1IVR1_9TELE
MCRNMLKVNDEIRRGDYISSPNGRYKAIFQHDGNFVIYEVKRIWSTETWGNQHRIVMSNGNLYMYENGNYPSHWTTRSGVRGTTESFACLLDDGNLAIQDREQVMWSSARCKGEITHYSFSEDMLDFADLRK